MSQIVAVTSGQCVLEKVLPEKVDNKFILDSINNPQFRIPFFSLYQQYQQYSGNNWIHVYENKNNNETVHYIKQFATFNNEAKEDKSYTKYDSSYDTVFMPHFWNIDLTTIINKDFICHGILKIYTFDENTNTFTEFETNDLNEYNQTKQYIIHNNGILSNGTKIPDTVREEIVKCNKLFVTFTFNHFDEMDNDEENQFLTRNKTFYGVYDFLPVEWKKTTPYPQTYYNEDMPTFIEPTQEQQTEICELMEKFMEKVKPTVVSVSNTSSAAGGGAYQNVSSNVNQSSKPDPSIAITPSAASVANPIVAVTPSVKTPITTPDTIPDPTKIVADTNPDPIKIVAVTNPDPNQIVAVTNPDPNTIVAVTNPDPNQIVAVTIPVKIPDPNPDPNTIVAVTNPDPNTIVAVTNPDPTKIVAVTIPDPNSMMMPQFGKTNKIYIKVIFDGIVPKTVDVVDASSGTSLAIIDDYINGLLDGTIQSDGTPVYFRLEKTYAENIVNMSSQ